MLPGSTTPYVDPKLPPGCVTLMLALLVSPLMNVSKPVRDRTLAVETVTVPALAPGVIAPKSRSLVLVTAIPFVTFAVALAERVALLFAAVAVSGITKMPARTTRLMRIRELMVGWQFLAVSLGGG